MLPRFSCLFVCFCMCMCCIVQLLCPIDCSQQAPLNAGFLRLEYWSGLPFLHPGDLPNPGMEPMSPASSVLAGAFFYHEPPGSPKVRPKLPNFDLFWYLLPSSLPFLSLKNVFWHLKDKRQNNLLFIFLISTYFMLPCVYEHNIKYMFELRKEKKEGQEIQENLK